MVKDEKGQPFKTDLGTNLSLDIYKQSMAFEQHIILKCKDNIADLDRYAILDLTLQHR